MQGDRRIRQAAAGRQLIVFFILAGRQRVVPGAVSYPVLERDSSSPPSPPMPCINSASAYSWKRTLADGAMPDSGISSLPSAARNSSRLMSRPWTIRWRVPPGLSAVSSKDDAFPIRFPGASPGSSPGAGRVPGRV